MNKLVLTACVLLGMAFADMPYGYYTFLRIAVCLVSSVVAWRLFEKNKSITFGVILMAGMAIIYNPIIQIELERYEWQWVNGVSIVLFLATIGVFKLFWARVLSVGIVSFFTVWLAGYGITKYVSELNTERVEKNHTEVEKLSTPSKSSYINMIDQESVITAGERNVGRALLLKHDPNMDEATKQQQWADVTSFMLADEFDDEKQKILETYKQDDFEGRPVSKKIFTGRKMAQLMGVKDMPVMYFKNQGLPVPEGAKEDTDLFKAIYDNELPKMREAKIKQLKIEAEIQSERDTVNNSIRGALTKSKENEVFRFLNKHIGVISSACSSLLLMLCMVLKRNRRVDSQGNVN